MRTMGGRPTALPHYTLITTEMHTNQLSSLSSVTRSDSGSLATESEIFFGSKFSPSKLFQPQNYNIDFSQDIQDTSPDLKELSCDSPAKLTNDEVYDLKETVSAHESNRIRGVCYCPSDKSWTAWWTEKGRNRKKAFKLSIHGDNEAKRLAIAYRRDIESKLPELRFTKSERRLKSLATPKIFQNNYDSSFYSDDEKHKITNSNKSDIISTPSPELESSFTLPKNSNYNLETSLVDNTEKSNKYNLREVIRVPSKLPEDYSSAPISNPCNKGKLTRQRVGHPFSPLLDIETNPQPSHVSSDHSIDFESQLDIQLNESLNITNNEMFNKKSPNCLNENLPNSPSLSSINSDNSKSNDYSPKSISTPRNSFNKAREPNTVFTSFSASHNKISTPLSPSNLVDLNNLRVRSLWKTTKPDHTTTQDSDSEGMDSGTKSNSPQQSPKDHVRGISFCTVNKAWCAQWSNLFGKACLKSYSVSKYGYEGAKKKAMQQRETLEASGQIGSRIPGVIFQNNAWKASWQEHTGENQTVAFIVGDDEMSYDCARRLAIACRKQKKKLTCLPREEVSISNKKQSETNLTIADENDNIVSSPKEQKMRKVSSPCFSCSISKCDSIPTPKRSRTASQSTTITSHDRQSNSPGLTSASPSFFKVDTSSGDPLCSPVFLAAPYTLDSPDFSEIPRGVQYDRNKRAFFVSWYNEDHKNESKYFNIQFGYNSAKQMAIHFLKNLLLNSTEIKYPSPSQHPQSITPAANMKTSYLYPSSFALDSREAYSNNKKTSIQLSLLGHALIDSFPPINQNKKEHSMSGELPYNSQYNNSSSSQNNLNITSNYKISHNFEAISSCPLSSSTSFLSSTNNFSLDNTSTSTSQSQSLLHRIQGLKQNDEDSSKFQYS